MSLLQSLKKWELHAVHHMYKNVHSNPVCNNPKPETIQMSPAGEQIACGIFLLHNTTQLHIRMNSTKIELNERKHKGTCNIGFRSHKYKNWQNYTVLFKNRKMYI